MYLVFIIFLYEITQMFLKSAPKKNYMLIVYITLYYFVIYEWSNQLESGNQISSGHRTPLDGMDDP